MRYMMLMYPGAKADQAGALPDAAEVAPMMKYNEELAKAGVLLALDGLHPTAEGARITKRGGRVTAVDGPFTESKEVLGGYWLIQVKSKAEAVEWASRCPLGPEDTIEVRRVFEMSEFGPEIEQSQAGAVSEIERHIDANRSAS